jgi:hypothetical protein
MGITTTRSPWSRERGEAHPRLAESPGSRSSPSNRADGHINPHSGKGWTPLSRRDSTPIVGGPIPPDPFDRR